MDNVRSFLGMSDASVGCGDGVRALQNACRDTFEGSAPCTSTDYIEAVEPPVHIRDGWILPSFVDFSVRPDGNVYAFDRSGLFASPDHFTCRGWQGVGRHLGVSANGAFSVSRAAGESHPVACCIGN